MTKYLFPVVLILLDIAAGVVYGFNGEFKMLTYWLAAAVLNICVTF